MTIIQAVRYRCRACGNWRTLLLDPDGLRCLACGAVEVYWLGGADQ